eukprot:1156188-Pelagomonas_calceolata.AAC.2
MRPAGEGSALAVAISVRFRLRELRQCGQWLQGRMRPVAAGSALAAAISVRFRLRELRQCGQWLQGAHWLWLSPCVYAFELAGNLPSI